MMPNSDPCDRFVHPYLTHMSDSYIMYLISSFLTNIGPVDRLSFCLRTGQNAVQASVAIKANTSSLA